LRALSRIEAAPESPREPIPKRPARRYPHAMLDACITLSRFNAELFAMAARSMGDAWMLLLPGAFWPCGTATPGNADLTTLGLDRMPPSGTELRLAYRRAAKAAHPDAGGSADAFHAVVEAFHRLAQADARTA
jgi:hypothetical protein